MRTYYFYPSMHDSSERIQVKLGACYGVKGMDCPLEKFGDIVTRWTSRVGTLQKLCPDEEKMKEDKKLSKKEEKNEKKGVKKMEKARLKTLRKDEVILRKEAREYDRVFCGREEKGKDWTEDKALIRTFCTACKDQSERCEDGAGDVRSIKVTKVPNTAPHFIPTFLGITLFSAVVAFGLYYSSSS